MQIPNVVSSDLFSPTHCADKFKHGKMHHFILHLFATRIFNSWLEATRQMPPLQLLVYLYRLFIIAEVVSRNQKFQNEET